jgi:glycosyltransferase involved in cell wall biosynthesis
MIPETNRLDPLVSVVMANFNGSAHLGEAIKSVQKQTLRNLEIIVSDDASSDNSVDIVKQLKATDVRIRLAQSDRNSGPSAARNQAIKIALGEWIAIMDSDDLIHPERLAILVDAATKDRADLVADDLYEFYLDGSTTSRRLLRGKWRRAPFWVNISDFVRVNNFYGPGPALGYLKPLIRASLLKEGTVAYDEKLRIGEDYNLVLRLLHLGKSMRVHPLPLYYYRKHSNSTSHRLNEGALAALKAADLNFLATISQGDSELANLVSKRIKSIEIALAYECLLSAIKGRHFSRALSIALSNPRAAALLRLPIGVRLRRFVPRNRKLNFHGSDSFPDAPNRFLHEQSESGGEHLTHNGAYRNPQP